MRSPCCCKGSRLARQGGPWDCGGATRESTSKWIVQVEVLYQIADVYALKGDRKRAAKMLRLTLDFVGADPGALARLGTLHAEGGARDDALRCYAAAHEQLADMDVLALLCAQHVNGERYEVAAGHFAAAARLQPGEPKWLLMVASCHRRAQKLEAALDLYEQARSSLLSTIHLCALPLNRFLSCYVCGCGPPAL